MHTTHARASRARRPFALLVIAALSLGAPPASAQKQSPPPVGTPKDFRLPAKRDFTLPNGMAVTLVPFGTVPKATVRLAVRAGNANEGPNEVWLADVTADLMNEGTATKTPQQVAEMVAGMGGDLSISVDPDLTSIGGDVLSEHAPEMVRLVADVARHPALPASELARIKGNKLRQLAIQKSQPQSIAQERFAQVLYGDHPYGRFFPTEQMLQGYTIEQVRAFHAAQFGARRAHLYVVGIFDRAAVEATVRRAFGDWASGPAPAVTPPKPKSGRSLALIDRPGAVQSTIVMGLPVPDPTSKDYTALQVTDAILGGTFGSRITTNIREQKGYTYSPFSFVGTHYHDAYWNEIADVTTNVTGASLKEIFHEIDRLQREAPPADELAGVKNTMLGIFTLQNGSRGGIVNQLRFVDLQGLPDDYLTGYVRRVMAVTPAEVQRVMRAYLRPEQMAIVVVGDRKTVEEQVAPYATVVP